MAYAPFLLGSPTSTAASAPFRKLGGAGPHLILSGVTTTWSFSSACLGSSSAPLRGGPRQSKGEKPSSNSTENRVRIVPLLSSAAATCPALASGKATTPEPSRRPNPRNVLGRG